MRRIAAFLSLALALVIAPPAPMAGVAHAQTVATTLAEAPDYEAWEAVAGRAEEALAVGRASDEALEGLRTELVAWRTAFLAAQDINAERIQTVRGQIESLGPVPAEGETEAEEVATRRAELNDMLVELQAPARRAGEAFTRAEGLIREIDSVIRERQAEALLERVRSPLNPSGWTPALSRVRETVVGITGEVRTNWQNPARRTALRDDLPITLALLFVALVLLVRGRVWMEQIGSRVFDRLGSRVAGLVLSTGQVIVPTMGILLLAGSLNSTGLLGLRGQAFVEALPFLVLSFFSARWIADRLFPKTSDAFLGGEMPPEDRRHIRWYAGAIGLVVGIGGVVNAMATRDSYPAEAAAAALFPVHVIMGLLLFRLGRKLLHYARARSEDSAVGVFAGSLLLFLARATIAFGVAGPVLAAAGYFSASGFTVFPVALTLALAGVVVILNRLLHELYTLVTGGSEDQTREALLPTLMGFVVFLAALPFLALIWGARVADLTDLWARFREGFAFGETRISPTDFLSFLIVFAIGYGVTRLVQSAMKTSVLPKTRLDVGGRNAVVAGLGYVGIFLAALIAITAAGLDLSSLAIVAGALSVGVGFGLQNIVQNFVAGIILLVERPIGEGDWVEVGSTMGIVKAISVRSTRIETFDKTEVIVPNADFISAPVTNWTRSTLTGRLIVPVGVAYGTDTRKVERILREIAEAQPLVVVDPPPMILFAGFGADSLDFEVRVILRDVNYILNVKNEINHEIARRFTEEGVEIPFAQRDIWLRNPEALSPARAATVAAAEAQTPVGAETRTADTKTEGRPAAAQITPSDMPEGGGEEGDGR